MCEVRYTFECHEYKVQKQFLRITDFKVICNEVPVYIRPRIPEKFWMDNLNSNDQSCRITKAHVARTLSNIVRLHTLEKRGELNSSKF